MTADRDALAILAILVACATCGSGESAETELSSWVVERTIDGNVTTVRNLVGSKWGGNATLEVITEIGVAEGDERYMFTAPYPFWATTDEIFVAEPVDGRVRVYGFDGVHRRDIGRAGEGPGEFRAITAITVLPDHRLAVLSGQGTSKLSFFTLAGEVLDEWGPAVFALGDGMSIPPAYPGIMTAPDGLVLQVFKAPPRPNLSTLDLELGLVSWSLDGLAGEPWFLPPLRMPPPSYSVERGAATSKQRVPLAAGWPVGAVAPTGERIWGDPNEYRFTIERPDASRVVVERAADPVPVSPEQNDYERRRIVHRERQRDPSFSWDGDGIPTTRPWYTFLVPDRSGRVWAVRPGPAQRADDCTEPEDWQPVESNVPCWQPTLLIDAFDLDGAYLGALIGPRVQEQFFGPHFGDEVVVARSEDESGVRRVIVYRIVLPDNPS